jgi:hypothetical protein
MAVIPFFIGFVAVGPAVVLLAPKIRRRRGAVRAARNSDAEMTHDAQWGWVRGHAQAHNTAWVYPHETEEKTP